MSRGRVTIQLDDGTLVRIGGNGADFSWQEIDRLKASARHLPGGKISHDTIRIILSVKAQAPGAKIK